MVDHVTYSISCLQSCAVVSSIPGGQTKSFECGGMVGRYVNIFLPGQKKMLTLCEVEVTTTLLKQPVIPGTSG